ncbi:MAG TPA: DNA polymerase III subunit delta [Steroidobacteraceae bacterium]|nr:DNA polymerase III subunit delta [Steroidobacteraceae bacterium]
MKLTSESLSPHLQRQLSHAYLISGDEPLTAGEAADAVRAKARASGCTEREVHFVGAGFSWNDLAASVNTLSLFAARKLVEIRLASAKPGAAGGAALVKLIEARIPDTLLLILAPRLDRDAQGADWVRAMQSHGAWVQVWPVERDKLGAWLAGRARALGLQIEERAAEVLVDRTEGNLLAAHQELEKLRLASPDGRITAEHVIAGVGDSARFDTFQLISAALEGDAPRALRILDGLRGEGVEPVLVLWALLRAQRDLWGTLVEAPAARSRGWSPQGAALERGRSRARRLDYRRLTERAVRADRMIKGRAAGSAWDEMAFLAAELCGRPVIAPAPTSL